eukprot:TRINITY_DN35620_c0_g1_i1.p1 TRINITY_DN35620_c0_g1~~TRINITY_DN35620_c0_g1_i1.p1  ORF type:complete len:1625 (+),score=312.83 TRINITY_DN35620_c0_g1_i1:49-4875(+)
MAAGPPSPQRALRGSPSPLAARRAFRPGFRSSSRRQRSSSRRQRSSSRRQRSSSRRQRSGSRQRTVRSCSHRSGSRRSGTRRSGSRFNRRGGSFDRGVGAGYSGGSPRGRSHSPHRMRRPGSREHSLEGTRRQVASPLGRAGQGGSVGRDRGIVNGSRSRSPSARGDAAFQVGSCAERENSAGGGRDGSHGRRRKRRRRHFKEEDECRAADNRCDGSGEGGRCSRSRRRKRRRRRGDDENDGGKAQSPGRTGSVDGVGRRRRRILRRRRRDEQEDGKEGEDNMNREGSRGVHSRSRSPKGDGSIERAEGGSQRGSPRVKRGRGKRMYTGKKEDGEEVGGELGPETADEQTKDGDVDGKSGSEAGSSNGSKGTKEHGGRHKKRRRRRRKLRSLCGSRSRSRCGAEGMGARRRRGSRRRSGSRRQGPSGRGRGRGGRSRSNDEKDSRPMVERVKGGVKLFVGRLPLEATSKLLESAFSEFGEVLEVFLIDSARATTGARCAFVRIGSLKDAENAINSMHEQRVLVPERRELGPIQVAFAKGEATRFGLEQNREQLPARWQVPAAAQTAKETLPPASAVDPDSLSKEALVSLIKEGQRTGGQPFKTQWWAYCDSGKGGVHDYDPKRHSRSSLRQFFVGAQQGEWGAKPWFRRAIQWAILGGRTGSRPRGARGGRRRRRRASSGKSSSYTSSSSSSSSSTSSASRRMRALRNRAGQVSVLGAVPPPNGSVVPAPPSTPPGVAAGQLTLPFLQGKLPPVGGMGVGGTVAATAATASDAVSGTATTLAVGDATLFLPGGAATVAEGVLPGNSGAYSLGELLRGQQPPPPEGPPPPEPDGKAGLSKARLLASALERNAELEGFLAKHRISPSTSFLMLKLNKEQADAVMASVTEQLESGLPGARPDREAEEAVLSRLKRLGIRTTGTGGGSWTSTERLVSPPRPAPDVTRGRSTTTGSAAAAAAAALLTGGRAGGNASALTPGSKEGDLDAMGLPSIDGLLGPGLPKVGSDADNSDEPICVSGADTVAAIARQVEQRQRTEREKRRVPQPPSPPLLGGGGANATEIAEASRELPSTAGARVYVKNIAKSTNEKELRELFERHGDILNVDIPKDKDTGTGKGFAFVTFARSVEAKRGIQALHFTKPWGRALIVERVKAPGEGQSPAPDRDIPPPPPSGEPPAPPSQGGDKGKETPASSSKAKELDDKVRRRKKPDNLRKKRRDSDSSSGRSRSASGSGSSGSSGSSGWSRYTVGSKRKKKEKDKHKAQPRRRRASKDSSGSSSRSSSGSYSYASRQSSRSRQRRHREKEEAELLAHAAEWAQSMAGPPGFGRGPPHFPMPPGMPPHMMPPPWALPPWGMPPPMFEDSGYAPFDREEAERQLNMAERRAKRDEKKKEDKATVWEDHPARVAAQRHRSRSPSRVPQRERSEPRPKPRRRRSKSGKRRSRSGSKRRSSSSSSSSTSRSSRASRKGGRRSSGRDRRDTRTDRGLGRPQPHRSGGGCGPHSAMPPMLGCWPPGMPPPPHGMMAMRPPPPGMMPPGPPPGMLLGGMSPHGMMLPPGPPPGIITAPHSAAAAAGTRHSASTLGNRDSLAQQDDSEDSEMDMDKVQDEINFADI